MSTTCLRAARTALPCLGRGSVTLCTSSYRAPPRGRSCDQRSCPVTGSFDRCVFLASGWLVWLRWLAPWPRSSKIPTSWSGLRVSSGLTASILCMSGGRSTSGSTSSYGCSWPTAAVPACGLHVLLISSWLAAVRARGERCRPYLVGTPRIRALCNGRHELHSPPQSYGGKKRPISIVYTSRPTDWIAWNRRFFVRVSSCEHRCSSRAL